MNFFGQPNNSFGYKQFQTRGDNSTAIEHPSFIVAKRKCA